MQKTLCFDLETAKVIPRNTDWKDQRPLGITCAALKPADGDVEVIYGQGPNGPLPKLPQAQAQVLVCKLQRLCQEYRLVTWNGASFDLQILAEESGLWDDCRVLAWDHCDIMFQFVCSQGFPVSLGAVAAGLELEAKTMAGYEAPALWAAGQHQQVLEYVAHDVELLEQIAAHLVKEHGFWWMTKSQRLKPWKAPQGLLTVREALDWPRPRRSLFERESFIGWL